MLRIKWVMSKLKWMYWKFFDKIFKRRSIYDGSRVVERQVRKENINLRFRIKCGLMNIKI